MTAFGLSTSLLGTKKSCCITSSACGINPHLLRIVISNCHYIAFAILPQLAIQAPKIDIDMLKRPNCLPNRPVVGSPMLFSIYAWLAELLSCIWTFGQGQFQAHNCLRSLAELCISGMAELLMPQLSAVCSSSLKCCRLLLYTLAENV